MKKLLKSRVFIASIMQGRSTSVAKYTVSFNFNPYIFFSGQRLITSKDYNLCFLSFSFSCYFLISSNSSSSSRFFFFFFFLSFFYYSLLSSVWGSTSTICWSIRFFSSFYKFGSISIWFSALAFYSSFCIPCLITFLMALAISGQLALKIKPLSN